MMHLVFCIDTLRHMTGASSRHASGSRRIHAARHALRSLEGRIAMMLSRTRSLSVALVLGGIFATACGGAPSDESSSTSQDLSASCAITPAPAKSLFVTDAATLKPFTFEAVFSQIVSTGSTTKQQPLAVYQQMFDTLNVAADDALKGPHCDDHKAGKNFLINGFPIECGRQEGTLSKTNPFEGTGQDTYVPIALVNRFDLAPSNGANCGQYRIVFGKRSGLTNALDRVLIIFEAVLPNPNPKAGLAACLPVAKFWDGLTTGGGGGGGDGGIDAGTKDSSAKDANELIEASTKDASEATEASTRDGGQIISHPIEAGAKETGGEDEDGGLGFVGDNVALPDTASIPTLESFYFKGLPGFAPVIRARNYGIGGGTNTGQIRANMFMNAVDEQEWELREFRTAQSCSGGSCTLTIQNTFVQDNPFGGLFAETGTEAAAFQTAFLSQVPTLAAKSIPAIAMTTPNAENAGESDEQELASIGRSDLTAQNILDRATTQSCAGCHERSVDVALGGGLTWPPSNGFTQIDESGKLSLALTGSFLPARAKVLTTFINANCSAADEVQAQETQSQQPDDGTTIGGGLVGAAN
jgi:hypothetical protein